MQIDMSKKDKGNSPLNTTNFLVSDELAKIVYLMPRPALSDKKKYATLPKDKGVKKERPEPLNSGLPNLDSTHKALDEPCINPVHIVDAGSILPGVSNNHKGLRHTMTESIKKERPERLNSGLSTTSKDSQGSPKPNQSKLLVRDEIMVSGEANNHKGLRPTMTDRFTKLPHTLLQSDEWKALSALHQNVFITILTNAAFSPCKFDVFGLTLTLKAGQFCGSFQQLADMCAQDVTRTTVQRGLKQLVKYGLIETEIMAKKDPRLVKKKTKKVMQSVMQSNRYPVMQSGMQSKTLVTIKVPGVYVLKKDLSDAISDAISDTPSDAILDAQKKNIYLENRDIPDLRYKSLLRDCGNVHNSTSKSASEPAITKKIWYDYPRRKFQNITEAQIEEWKVIFPDINIRAEIATLAQSEYYRPKMEGAAPWEVRILSWLKKSKATEVSSTAISEPSEIDVESNKKVAYEMVKKYKFPGHTEIEFLNEYVEFVVLNMSHVVNYDEPYFYSKLKSTILKCKGKLF